MGVGVHISVLDIMSFRHFGWYTFCIRHFSCRHYVQNQYTLVVHTRDTELLRHDTFCIPICQFHFHSISYQFGCALLIDSYVNFCFQSTSSRITSLYTQAITQQEYVTIRDNKKKKRKNSIIQYATGTLKSHDSLSQVWYNSKACTLTYIKRTKCQKWFYCR